MVQGVLVCGNSMIKMGFKVNASLILLVLTLGGVSLGLGLDMDCYHYDSGNRYMDTNCYNTKLYLIINGAGLIVCSVLGLTWLVTWFREVRDVPGNVAPTAVAQPYVMYNYTAAVCPDQAVAVYPVASPGQPQKSPVAAFTSAGVNQGHFQQYPMNGPQMHDPDAAPSNTQEPSSEHHM